MKTTPQRFTAAIEIRGINPYVRVHQERANALAPGWKKPLPVRVRINGKPKTPWRINMMPVGDGSFYLYLHADVREASGTKVGDTVSVDVRRDPAYRNGPMHPMPAWFRDALAENPAATGAWAALPPSRQKEILRYFSNLQSDAAKKRNAEKAIRVLSGSQERFMARAWKDGK